MRSSRSLMSRTSFAVAGAARPARLVRSSVARATNELVIAAVITARKASPSSITSRGHDPPGGVGRDVVAITHRSDRLDRPPEPLADRGEVLVVDRRHEQAKADCRDGRDRGDDRGTAAGRLGARKGTVEPALEASLVLHRHGVRFAGPSPTRSCHGLARLAKRRIRVSCVSGRERRCWRLGGVSVGERRPACRLRFRGGTAGRASGRCRCGRGSRTRLGAVAWRAWRPWWAWSRLRG